VLSNFNLYCEIISILLLVDFIFYLPLKNIFFDLYFNDSRRKLLNFIKSITFIAWPILLLCILFGFYRLPSSIFLVCIFRYFFINTRWSSLLRGGGAPGYMSYYTLLIIMLCEISFMLPDSNQEWAGYLIKIDFGVIILCSGLYKSLTGYLNSDGMEYGLANPLWSYFFSYFAKVNPRNIFFKIQNISACVLQIIAGFCICFSPINHLLGYLGGTLVCLSFIYLLPLIRLGRLSAIMMSIGILFLPDINFSFLEINKNIIQASDFIDTKFINGLFKTLFLIYLPLLIIIKITQYLNLFKNIYWPFGINYFFSKIANFFPIIIWRVFTPDVTNFYIIIRLRNKINNSTENLVENSTYDYSGFHSFWTKFRYLHVMESIVLTTIFNSLRYFHNNPKLFNERLLRYSKTLPNHSDKIITYDYMLIEKTSTNFNYTHLKSFIVDTKKDTINTMEIGQSELISKSSTYSPVHITNGFGHY
jgi:hypothetical protein